MNEAHATPASNDALKPIAENERMIALDVLRGFAIFGIFMVNIQFFALPVFEAVGIGAHDGVPVSERIAAGIVKAFFEYKFVSTFSFLFGAGLVMQYQRAKAKGRSFTGPFTRRTMMLFTLGAIHAFGMWYGDILFIYSWCALATVFAIGFKASTKFKIAAVLLVLSVVQTIGMGLLQTAMASAAEDASDASEVVIQEDVAPTDVDAGIEPVAQDQTPMDRWYAALDDVDWQSPTMDGFETLERLTYHEGPFAGSVLLRLMTYGMYTFFGVILGGFGARVLGMFLLGMACMTMGFFGADKAALHRRLMILGLSIGIPGELFFAYAMVEWISMDQSMAMMGVNVVHNIASLALCLGYIGTVCLVANSGAVPWLTKAIANVGRMALTNYLMQTVIATFVMYWWGLAQFDEWTRVQQLLFVIAIYVGQIIFSAIWLKIFRMGPLEAMWRSVTYMKIPKMLRG